MSKIVGIILALALGLFITAVSAQATQVEVALPTFPVTINGVRIDNDHLVHPLVVYRGITYFPLTYYDSRFMGLGTNYTSGVGLSVWVSGLQEEYIGITQAASNLRTATAQRLTAPIRVNGRVIDNTIEEFPLLLFRDVVYFPLTWRFVVEEFGWYSRFTADEGLTIVGACPDALDAQLERLVRDALDTLLESEPLAITFRNRVSSIREDVLGILHQYRDGTEYWVLPPIGDLRHQDFIDVLELLPEHRVRPEVRWCYDEGFPRVVMHFVTGELASYVEPGESPGHRWGHTAYFDLNTRTLRSLWTTATLFRVTPEGRVDIATPPRRSWLIMDFTA